MGEYTLLVENKAFYDAYPPTDAAENFPKLAVLS